MDLSAKALTTISGPSPCQTLQQNTCSSKVTLSDMAKANDEPATSEGHQEHDDASRLLLLAVTLQDQQW